MSDQIHPALRAPQPNDTTATTPTPAPNAEASHQTSRPATATHTPEATAAPATAPSATTFPPPQHATTEQPLSLNEKLNNADRYWKFKGVFQVVIILSGLAGIGAVARVVATEPYEGFFFEYPSFWAIWPSLITFSLSVIWCAICIIVLVRRKRPVHAGLRVAMDLLFWLGFIGTALLALLAYSDLVSWGEFGTVDASWNSYSGSYYFTNNGTWVWRQSRDSSVSYPRNCGNNVVYNFFPDCQAQDAFVNKLWQEKPGRVSAELAAVVCQFISLVAHFIVFVWACVDCHRYNHSKVSQDAEKLAANIVQTMIENGAIVPPPGQARMKPIPWGQPGHYQLSGGQMYPMAVVYPQHAPVPQQYTAPHGSQQAPPLPPRPAAGPVNEKSEGPRYA